MTPTGCAECALVVVVVVMCCLPSPRVGCGQCGRCGRSGSRLPPTALHFGISNRFRGGYFSRPAWRPQRVYINTTGRSLQTARQTGDTDRQVVVRHLRGDGNGFGSSDNTQQAVRSSGSSISAVDGSADMTFQQWREKAHLIPKACVDSGLRMPAGEANRACTVSTVRSLLSCRLIRF